MLVMPGMQSLTLWIIHNCRGPVWLQPQIYILFWIVHTSLDVSQHVHKFYAACARSYEPSATREDNVIYVGKTDFCSYTDVIWAVGHNWLVSHSKLRASGTTCNTMIRKRMWTIGNCHSAIHCSLTCTFPVVLFYFTYVFKLMFGTHFNGQLL